MKQKIYMEAYYHELWDETVIEQDIAEMKKLNLNVIRIGEFTWATMEPKINEIDISYFI